MRDKDLYDVGIIGGGLAGLSLAIQCADYGYHVALFEKEEYPFHKVCGEYISLESWNFLKRLGIHLDALELPVINKLHLSDARGKTYLFSLPLGGFGISRYTLDNMLYQTAIAKGVDVYTKTKVNDVSFGEFDFVITSTNKTTKAKVAAACFGKRSNLDVKWKRNFTIQKANPLNNYIGIKYHINYSHSPELISLHNFYNGYCGISKIENNKSCLCYLTTADNLRRCGNSIAELQSKILCTNPRLREIFTTANFLSEPVAISQISFSKKKQVENHLLMLGDAAGMISPLCGNGMSMAMHSAKLAFIAIGNFLTGKASRAEMESYYTKSWNGEFAKRLWMGRNVQRFFGGNFSTSVFLGLMHKLPFLSQLVIRSTHGRDF